MKHFNAAFKKLFPALAPLVEAAERDVEEPQAEAALEQAAFEAKREQRRREWEERSAQRRREQTQAQLAPLTSESLFDRLSLHMRTREARGASAEELALLAEARAEIERLRLMRETSQEALRECMAELREAREENLALREQDVLEQQGIGRVAPASAGEDR